MEPSREASSGIAVKYNSEVPYRYPLISFVLSGIGWIFFIFAFFVYAWYARYGDQSPLTYCGVITCLVALVISIVGFFKTNDKARRWKCVKAAFVATSPFLLYLFLILVIFPTFLQGIGA